MAGREYVKPIRVVSDDKSLEKVKSDITQLKEEVASPIKVPVEIDQESSNVTVNTAEAESRIKNLTNAIENFKKMFSFDLKTPSDPFSEFYDKIISNNKEVVSSMGDLGSKVNEIFGQLKSGGDVGSWGLTTEQIKEQIKLQLQLAEIQERAKERAGEIYSSKGYMQDPAQLKELLRLFQEIEAINARNRSQDVDMVRLLDSEALGDISRNILTITDSANNAKVKITDIIKSLSSDAGGKEIIAGWQAALTELQNVSDQTAAQVVSDQKEQTAAIQETVAAQGTATGATANISVDKELILAKVREALDAIDELVKSRAFPLTFTVTDESIRLKLDELAQKSVKIPVDFDSAGTKAKVDEIVNTLNTSFNSQGFTTALQTMEPALAGVSTKLHIAVKTWEAELGLFNTAIGRTKSRLEELRQGGIGGTAAVNVDDAVQNVETMRAKIEELRTLLSGLTIGMILDDKSYQKLLSTLTKVKDEAKNIPVKFTYDSALQKGLKSQLESIEKTVRKIKVQLYTPIAEGRKEINATIDQIQSKGLHKIDLDFKIGKMETLEKINQAIDTAGQKFQLYNQSVIQRSEEQVRSLSKVWTVLVSIKAELNEIKLTADSLKGLDFTKKVRSTAKAEQSDEFSVKNVRKAGDEYNRELERLVARKSQILSAKSVQNIGNEKYFNVEAVQKDYRELMSFAGSMESRFDGTKKSADALIGTLSKLEKQLSKTQNQNRSFGREEAQLNTYGHTVEDVTAALERKAGSEAKVVKQSDTSNGAYKKVIATMKETQGEVKQYTARINNATGAVELMGTTTIRTNTVMEKFLSSFKNKGVEVATWLTTFASFHQVVRQVREGLGIVRDIDVALTELRKVSDASDSAINKFKQSSFDIGQVVGATGEEIIQLAADYSRLGLTA